MELRVRSTRSQFYNAILERRRINAPHMKEARRDLDRAFYSVQMGALVA
jgi:hypothetical protein